jgi:threonylcarbamoyladenosine tRNA methylthiotransferase MtaB
MPVKYSIITFGCRVNQADSMGIERELRASGGVESMSATADLVIVNSCSVTATADQGTRQAVRRIARENPAARIVVTGCYATRCAGEVAALPNVVSVVPNSRKDRLVEDTLTTADRFVGGDGACGAPSDFLLDRTALTVRVQTGCNEHCSYCIIPATRGAAMSKTPAAVVEELRTAEASGFLEVTLTGVHLGSYGRDLAPASSLTELLDTAARGTCEVLLRLGSLEPMDVPATLPSLCASVRLAPTFHLPLQHASDAVLARMRRPYTLDDYRRTVDPLRSAMPDAAVGSDIIVGFPGETSGDFDLLCGYLESSPLTSLHVFPYSDRPGTEASGMTGKVAPNVVRERGRIVRDIGRQLADRFHASQVGAVRPALTIGDGSTVVTDNGIKLRLPVPLPRNQRLRVRVGNGIAEPIQPDPT